MVFKRETVLEHLKKRFWRITGLLLIAGGLAVLGYTAYQKAMVAYHQQKLRRAFEDAVYELPPEDEDNGPIVFTEWHPMRIVIPKIGVDLMVLQGDVFDQELLDRGPVHFSHVDAGSVYIEGDLPGTEPGNVAIAGHRGGRWNFFLDVDYLEEGDEIYLDFGGYRFIYLVEWVRIVDPYDWSVIQRTDYPAVTLQTCYPKNRPATHRLIVRGALDRVEPAPAAANSSLKPDVRPY